MYTIPSRVYVLDADSIPGGRSGECTSAFQDGGDDFWLVGDPWFRAVYSALNVEDHLYGMAPNAKL